MQKRYEAVTTLLRRWLPALLAAAGVLWARPSSGRQAPARLPEGNKGIAAKYPGDQGLSADPAVVLVEHFEDASLDVIGKRWDNVKNRAGMSLTKDVPRGSAGVRSLLITHVGGEGTGAHLYRRLLPGYEKLHVRYYVKFDPGCFDVHHFGPRIGGYNPSTPWPQGGAGNRPKGDDRLSFGFEPHGKAWRWDFYNYWCEMKTNPSGRYWGNDFINDKTLAVVRGRWICVELMLKLNNPVSETNGEMAVWIDGRLWRSGNGGTSHFGPGFPAGKWVWDSFHPGPGQPFDGLRWRKSPDLKINWLWLYLYITKAPEGHVSKVWYDNVVVARSYIGPIATKKRAEARKKASAGKAAVADPLEAHRDSVREAEGLLRKGDVDGARSAYDNIRRALAADDQTARSALEVRLEGARARGTLIGRIRAAHMKQGALAVSISGRKAKVLQADHRGIVLRERGMEMRVRWDRVEPGLLSKVAAAYAPDGASQLMLAQHLLACGRKVEAGEALSRARKAGLTAEEGAKADRVGDAVHGKAPAGDPANAPSEGGPVSRRPAGAGLAWSYREDRGIARDPSVILFEDYELADVGALRRRGWSSARWDCYEIDDVGAFSGTRSLKKIARKGAPGAIMPIDLKRPEDGAVHHRMYVKFPRDVSSVRVMGITGVREGWPTWKAIGSAGVRPDGTDYYCVTLTLQKDCNSARFMFYPYHMDQKGK